MDIPTGAIARDRLGLGDGRDKPMPEARRNRHEQAVAQALGGQRQPNTGQRANVLEDVSD